MIDINLYISSISGKSMETSTRLPIIANVEGLGKIVEANRDFYTNLQLFKEEGARPISPRDEAYARLKTRGKENIGKSYGTRTCSGFEHVKGEYPILKLFDSRLLNPELAKLAVEANRQERYFCTDSAREYEDSLKQAEKDRSKEPKDRNVIILPSRNPFEISDEENWDVFESISKDQARAYFELNGSIIIFPVNTSYVDSQNGTLLTQMQFGYLVLKSVLGDGRSLGGVNQLRGVKETSEAGSQKRQE